jgi:hypothetical protein
LPEEQYETGLTRFIQVQPSQAVDLDDVDVDDIEVPAPDTAAHASAVVLQLTADPDAVNESVLDEAGHSTATSPAPDGSNRSPTPLQAEVSDDDFNDEPGDSGSTNTSPEPLVSTPVQADAHVHPDNPNIAQADSGQGDSQEDSEEETHDSKGAGDTAPLTPQLSFAEPEDGLDKTLTSQGEGSRTLDFQVMPAGVPTAWSGYDDPPEDSGRATFD